ncbi:CopG family ribbon-helix-helix protein [Xanthomonas fragariae]
MDSRAGEAYYHKVLPSDKRGQAMATSLKIDDGLKNRVQQLASQRRRSAHWIMLEAIEQYVQRERARALSRKPWRPGRPIRKPAAT